MAEGKRIASVQKGSSLLLGLLTQDKGLDWKVLYWPLTDDICIAVTLSRNALVRAAPTHSLVVEEPLGIVFKCLNSFLSV